MSAPRFSIITPVFDPPLDVLESMVYSVRRQTSSDWEHCVVDDGSTDNAVRSALERIARAEPRIRVRFLEARSGIVAATNEGLDMAEGAFVVFLDHDDTIEPEALEAMSSVIDAQPEVDLVYSNEDKIDERDRHLDPFLKPAWSPDRLRCQQYVGHLTAMRRSLVEDLGGARPGLDGAQDWDLVLRVTERARQIEHVPEILYHWRTLVTSAARRADAKPWAHAASRKAVADHVARGSIQATVEQVPGYPGHYWLRPALETQPLVSVVIPTAGRTHLVQGKEIPLVVTCVESVIERSTYQNLELVVVVDGDVPDAVVAQLGAVAGDRLKIVPFDRPFNFSAKINLGVAESRGEVLLLLNDDIEVLPVGWRPTPKRAPNPVPVWPTVGRGGRRIWVESMLVYVLQPGVGAVGAKLYFPDGRIQHAGVIGKGGVAGHVYYGREGNESGYWGNLIAAGDYLAVTGACLMTSRASFDQVGGFAEDLPVNYNDVDFCLRLREAGLRSVVPPEVELLHRESSSRGPAPVRSDEIAELMSRWGDVLDNDPYYDRRFIDGHFTVRPASRLRAYLARADQLQDEGGLRLVLARVARKVGRTVRSFARRAREVVSSVRR